MRKTRKMPKTNSRTTNEESRCTVAQVIARALKRHGVELIFGQSLPSALILAAEDEGIPQIAYRTENAGGCMADAFSRISNKISIVTAQNGPAATLLVAPLAEAFKASVPMLALVQDVPLANVDRNAFQELDHQKLFEGAAKWIKRVDCAERIEDYIDLAVIAATSGKPGPAVLMLPADMLDEIAPTPAFERTESLGSWPLDRFAADKISIQRAALYLKDARNPIVIAGGGVHGSQACTEIARLQEEAHIPVAYTTMGKGVVDDNHPLTIGLIGNTMGKLSLGSHTRQIVAEADVVLMVGTRTNQNGTDSWTIPHRDAKVIHIDVDAQEIGRTFEPAVRLVGDAKLTSLLLLEELKGLDLTNRKATRGAVERTLQTEREKWTEATKPVRMSSASPIRPERVMQELQSILTKDTIIVADASYSSNWVATYLNVCSGQRVITPRGLAGLGWGFPMALGAKLASPTSHIVCLSGDGGFGHCWAELETAARIGISVTVVLLNNGVLGYQRDAETVLFDRYTNACHFFPVNHAAIAEACGVNGHRIENPAILSDLLKKAANADRMTLLEVITDPDAYPPVTMFDDQASLENR